MLKGQTVLCISSIDWDFIWQGHQQIMSMLAAHGNNVLFIENTGARRPTLRDVPRLRQRIRNWWRGTKGFRQERDRKSTRLNSSHSQISYAVFCLKKKTH